MSYNKLSWSPARPERRSFWAAILTLCAIAVAISIRRLLLLVTASGGSDSATGDDLVGAAPALVASHVLPGLILALGIPVQISSRVRRRFPRIHRWHGRFLVIVGLLVGVSAYGMSMTPVGGWLETSATTTFGTAFLITVAASWWHIRHHDVPRHREWMLRAIAIALGIATTRPVMAIFFATSRITGLQPPQFFGIAMWIGFSSTVLAGEWYVRSTRRLAPTRTDSRLRSGRKLTVSAH
jgi:hypothetical protein